MNVHNQRPVGEYSIFRKFFVKDVLLERAGLLDRQKALRIHIIPLVIEKARIFVSPMKKRTFCFSVHFQSSFSDEVD